MEARFLRDPLLGRSDGRHKFTSARTTWRDCKEAGGTPPPFVASISAAWVAHPAMYGHAATLEEAKAKVSRGMGEGEERG
jgi:hypothetical protein